MDKLGAGISARKYIYIYFKFISKVCLIQVALNAMFAYMLFPSVLAGTQPLTFIDKHYLQSKASPEAGSL